MEHLIAKRDIKDFSPGQFGAVTGICKTISFFVSLSCLVVAVILETLHLVILETASQQQITVKTFVLAELLKAIVVHVKLVLRNQLCVTSVIVVIFV